MADEQFTAKVSYPYLTSGQWFAVRERLRKSVPKEIDVDWLMAALGGSEKGAQNVLPQLRAIGLLSADNKPLDGLVHDLRDDGTYGEACRRIREAMYPAALLEAWNDPSSEPDKVAAWFMRNAGTGAATAKMQARFYLLLLKGELPSADQVAKASTKKAPASPARKPASKPAGITANGDKTAPQAAPPIAHPGSPMSGIGPALHIDLQIHISADASDTQIDSIFKSMARHLYGRE